MRAACVLVLAAVVAWCARSGGSAAIESVVAAQPQARGLDVVERGAGTCAVVLLHGYGAPPDDLVGLGEVLAASVPARFVMPGAPRSVPGGGSGRAWFGLDASPDGAEVRAAREAIDAVVTRLRSEGAQRVIVGGFSQGGILSIDLALVGAERLDGIAVLSGRALERPASTYARLRGLRIYQSHGATDGRIAFARGEAFRRAAEAAGAALTFHRFAGGHTIPSDVESSLAAWLGTTCR